MTMNFYSKLDLPLYVYQKPVHNPAVIDRLYIGSDKSYAEEPREVKIIGKSLSLGIAVAALLQPAGPLMAAGFLLVGLINAKDLVTAVKSKPARRSEWSFIGSGKTE